MMKTITPVKTENAQSGFDIKIGGRKNDKKKTIMIDVMDAAETYFVKITTIKKIVMKMIKQIG